jgi:23S rRNA (uridine2552-2'-O)-methyltransferase
MRQPQNPRISSLKTLFWDREHSHLERDSRDKDAPKIAKRTIFLFKNDSLKIMYRKDKQSEFYTTLAKKEGYPARSIYKLKEIDKKYKIIKAGDRILDLGSAPGSWLLYISQKVGDKGKVVGVDAEEIKISPKANIAFIRRNIFDLKESDFKDKFEVVVSDLSPKTSGIKLLDSGKSMELAEKSFEIAKSVLLTGGNFVCKIFESESSKEFFKKMNKYFELVNRLRPKAVIKASKEFYIIGRGFKV